jgi:hypothetical protein
LDCILPYPSKTRCNASALRRDFGQNARAPSGRRQTVLVPPMTADIMTFRAAFEDFFEMKAPQLSNPKHAAQWRSTMEMYAFPSVGQRPIQHYRLDCPPTPLTAPKLRASIVRIL